ncbi:glycosyl hydrolase [Aureococcus anophagefferens]|nr:glycosyl hydrolase [Aureococcus anophagefferens]
MAVESALRIPDAFRLARAYPHVYLHEPDLPRPRRTSPAACRAVFRASGPSSGGPGHAEAAWVARDRSPGYKTMCRFYGLQVFGAMRDLGVDAFMRVDDDVLFLGAVAYDPFQWMYEAGAVYVYGTAVREDHDVTERTLGAWVFEFCAGIDWGWTKVDCGALRDDVFGRMFFNNAAAGAGGRGARAIVMATRTAFWFEAPLERLLWEIDRTGSIYVHRWGDAPIQTAAVRLFAPTTAHARLPVLSYVHLSGKDYVECGALPAATRGGLLLRGPGRRVGRARASVLLRPGRGARERGASEDRSVFSAADVLDGRAARLYAPRAPSARSAGGSAAAAAAAASPGAAVNRGAGAAAGPRARAGPGRYSTFSLWDTYRAQHPLLNLLHPRLARDVAESLLLKAEDAEHSTVESLPRAQAALDRIAALYTARDDGLPGNDDVGQTSAWPLFADVSVDTGAGRTLRIVVRNAGLPYVRAAFWGETRLASTRVPVADVHGGGTLTFVLGLEPGDWTRY